MYPYKNTNWKNFNEFVLWKFSRVRETEIQNCKGSRDMNARLHYVRSNQEEEVRGRP